MKMATFWVVLTLAVAAANGGVVEPVNDVSEKIPEMAVTDNVPAENSTAAETLANRLKLIKFAKQMKDTVTDLQEAQKPSGIVDQTVRINFLNTLFLMANASAVTGARVSRAAATIIRGFVQDSFNLVSIGAYLPRLIFLDGPTQFIEILRLTRTGQIRIPQDVDEAMDTVINFASIVRESQISGNLGTPFLHFFPNVFRGAELLSGEIIYGVFSWLGPLAPGDISSASVEGLWNRWDIKSSTTSKYDSDKRWQTNGVSANLYQRPWFQSSTTDEPSNNPASSSYRPSDSTEATEAPVSSTPPVPEPAGLFNFPRGVQNPFSQTFPASTPPPGVRTYTSTTPKGIFSLSNFSDLFKLNH